MESLDNLEKLPVSPSAPTGFIKRSWRGFLSLFVALGQNIYWLIANLFLAAKWSFRELSYWFRLFLFTSRLFIRVESFLALIGAFAFFGWVVTQNHGQNMRELLYYCYIYFSVVMVLLCMNILPRERDDETLEILWSQPIRRGALIVLQLITVTIWQLIFSLLVISFFSYFSAYTEGRWTIVLLLTTTSFAVGSITILVSTFCKHGIATGLVSLLILGVHFFWLTSLGPIELFANPIAPPGVIPRNSPFYFILFNRIFVLVLAGFVLDYLFRQLRQTSKWFT
jgi:ABC-2 family transporter